MDDDGFDPIDPITFGVGMVSTEEMDHIPMVGFAILGSYRQLDNPHLEDFQKEHGHGANFRVASISQVPKVNIIFTSQELKRD